MCGHVFLMRQLSLSASIFMIQQLGQTGGYSFCQPPFVDPSGWM
jgi:hypothetical protein